MKHTNGKYKRIFRFLSTIWALVLQTAVFGFFWTQFYNERINQSFAMRGNWLMIAIYLVILILFTNVYGGFRIGYQKPGSLTMSQGIAACGSNVVIYLVILLLSSESFLDPTKQIPSPWQLLLATVIQILLIAVSAWILTAIYNRLFPPRKLIMIYGNYLESAELLRTKMNGLKEKYQVVEMISDKAGYETLIEKANQYEGVVMVDVEVKLRNRILKYCYGMAIRVYVAPSISDIILSNAESLHFFDTPLLLARNSGLSMEQKLAKRILDLVISGIGIVIFSPVMLVTAIAIKIQDGGPVFFRQARATNGGKVFKITKFRSMIVDAEKEGFSIPATDRDPRITPVGNFIRGTRIDELPQLFDVFRGDMSIVGPRPERVEHVKKYTESIPEFSYRLKVKGGLTGYAQIYGKYNTSPYDKLKLDLMYIENYSLLLDIKLILMTIKIMFTKESTEGFTQEKSAAMHEEESKENE
jgi:exopolysaccharide biosynthesis polyprenyl glycosylphosphotransferase